MPKGQWIKIKQYKQAKTKVQQNSSQSLEDTKNLSQSYITFLRLH